jgi:N-acetyl-anhydromuramyl-L-alanine amidase AmpD
MNIFEKASEHFKSSFGLNKQPDELPTGNVRTFVERFVQTPNISANREITPIGIVLHHTDGSFNGSVQWCLNPESQVSYHCIVNTNGDRTILAGDNQRAFHAGRSNFKGRVDCNSFMLGIAVSGNTYNRELTQDEIASISEWCVNKIKKFNMPLDLSTITTHGFVSPGRKNDVSPEAEKQILDRIKQLL